MNLLYFFRLTAKSAMEQIEEVLGNEDDDPYVAVDLVDLMKKTSKERESAYTTSSPRPDVGAEFIDRYTKSGQLSVLQHRIEELKV